MRQFVRLTCATIVLVLAASGQRQAGELRLQIVDGTGAAIAASGELVNNAVQFRKEFTTGPEGQQTFSALPFGIYRLKIEREGFTSSDELIEIRSQVPLVHRVMLVIAPIETTVEVSDAQTLLNPDRTGASQQIGLQTIETRASAIPGRGVIDLVDTQPGWLLEANGVLHPRGAEYGVQYVVDGLPILDNRSPNFAPTLDIDEFQSLVVRTGGYPAEYGRQLGGVIEATSIQDSRPGFHGKAVMEGGGFRTASGSLTAQYAFGGNTVGFSGSGMTTDRYLDPPVLQNYTNHGSGTGFGGRWARDWGPADRTVIEVRHDRTGFLVPNENIQQAAGQRDDRTAEETSSLVSYTHLFSPRVLLDAHGSVRDVAAALWSNPDSTPIAPFQNRGFREGYAATALSIQHGIHDFKFGADALFRSIQEQFAYQIIAYRLNGIRIFDQDTPQNFAFFDRRQDREQGAFVQDQIRFHSLTVNAGVRWDHYKLFVDEQAASPRLAVAWDIPHAGLVLRASYDRAFQMPAIENLLLASSVSLLSLNDNGVILPVRPSHGDFYETGFAKSFFGKLRLDASYYRREIRNFADDDLLLNTGISFPIAFNSATIYGVEAKLELPRWGPLSGFISYSNMRGVGRFPVTGGLFLEDNAAALLTSTDRFPITQDQRNTARARFRYQVLPRLWFAIGAEYGSGLPVEIEDFNSIPLLAAQYGPQIVSRVNFSAGRVRPSFSLDLSAGAEIWKHEKRAVRLQADVVNVTNRLNVINFAGLFSGTAVATPRWASARVQLEF